MSKTSSEENLDSNNVINLTQFRKKKELAQELGQGRKPLYINQSTGTISGNSSLSKDGQENGGSNGNGADFGDRLQRIRTSLDRINALMTELRGLSKSKGEPKP